jgi:hypothetical protein
MAGDKQSQGDELSGSFTFWRPTAALLYALPKK